MQNITILLSASGSPTMPGALKCFKNNGEREIRIVGIDMSVDPTCRFMVDSFYQVPPVTDPLYFSIVLDICKKENVDIYFPNISFEVGALVEYQNIFEKAGVKLSISNPYSIKVANNKLHTYQLLERSGIPVPEYYEVKSVNDFKFACKELGYPNKALCLKIVEGSGSRGVRVIDNSRSRYKLFSQEKPSSLFTSYDDMVSILESEKKLDTMMLMHYFPGNEYTVDALADHGKVLYQVGRENVDSLMSIAQESVLSKNDFAFDISQRIIELLGYDGNIGIDFMKGHDGIPILTDINPRITATVSVIAAGGVNLPYLRVKQLLGEKLPSLNVRYGTRLKRRYLELFCDADGNEIIF